MIGWQVKAIAAAVLIAALGGLLWHDKHQTDRANRLAREVAQANATIEAERQARATEADDRRKADESAKSLQAELDRIAAAPKPVSVYCRPARMPNAGESGAATVADDSAAGSGAEEPLQDIGAALADVWREHQSNAARHRGLIEWERNRSH